MNKQQQNCRLRTDSGGHWGGGRGLAYILQAIFLLVLDSTVVKTQNQNADTRRNRHKYKNANRSKATNQGPTQDFWKGVHMYNGVGFAFSG